jgi:hypothetical protein
MAFMLAVSVTAVSPLLLAHVLIRPSVRKDRRDRARSQAHRTLAQQQEMEALLFKRVKA